MVIHMIKIGLIGSDNSHAVAFSQLANIPDHTGTHLFSDVRITCIYGEDKIRTREVADIGHIDRIVDSPADMLTLVDAVMVVFRHGGLHFAHALPFVKAGIPTWVDKPFTIDLLEAVKLTEAAREYGTLLSGGSTCKYCPDILALREEFLGLDEKNAVISGHFNFPGELDSPYGGIFFYGGHAIEMLITIFGADIRSIKADVHCGNVIAIMKYDRFAVTVNFSEVSEFFAAIYSPLKVVNRRIDISDVYRHGFSRFIDELHHGEMSQDYENFVRPVRFLNVLNESIQSGKEVYVCDF